MPENRKIQVKAWDPVLAQEVEKPRWEYGGTFDRAWRGVSDMLELVPQESHVAEWLAYQRWGLAHAHVVTLDQAQFDALPREATDLTDYDPDPHQPFPIMYISVGSSGLAGVLVVSSVSDNRVVAVPYLDNAIASHAVPLAWLSLTDHTFVDYLEHYDKVLPNDDDAEPYGPQERQGMIAYATDAVAILRFMESTNVDLEETPVSRQVRRQAQRKDTPISLRVYVRSPRTRRTSDESTEHVDFSHRFEVAGHYKHYGPDTQMFRATERDRPHKVINHPTRGRIIRVWCPDFVKGPEDKPLVPKTRVYKKEDE